MRRAGFTLLEILIATTILAFGLMTLMVSLGNCARMMGLSREYQDAQFVFDLGERLFPIPPSDEIAKAEEDERLNIDPVSVDAMLVELGEDLPRERLKAFTAFTFERHVDERPELETNEVDDKLYLLRTRVAWGSGREVYYEELVRYVRQK